mgnify:CR=1 FL=1
MKKIIIISIIILVSVVLLLITSLFIYDKWKIANAKIIVELHDNLNIEVFSEVKLSDLIKSINGNISDDFKIDTTKIGKKMISFKYINNDNIEVSYNFEVDIVDTKAPYIFSSNSLTITKGYEGNLAEELFCGDNYDDTPKCEIVGEYDINTIGNYPLTFTGTDSSGNISKQDFTLIVKEKQSSSSTTITQNYADIVTKYKTENTKIGLDVSRWQGDIDFQQVRDAGVEFVFIRVGSQKGIDGEYYIDPKFEQNIKGFQSVGIPVGIYFYSYANSNKSAKKEAEWVIEKIKPYKIDLPVVFDWENWSFYQEFDKSFYNLTEMANTYLKTIEKAGYKGMLYSSKNYLENVWFKTKYPVWLAHYTTQTTYQGEYKVWQLCANGRIPGINGNVDINVMYS